MKKGIFALACILSVVAVTLTACGGTSSTITPVPTANIGATPTSVAPGGASVLSYACGNSTSAVASGGWSNTLSLSGTVTVNPTATTTYTLTCNGAGESATASVTVTVTSVAAPKPTISASVLTLPLGQSFQLTWNGDTGTTVSVSGPAFTSTALTGSASVTPPATGANVYTISATNAGGTTTESVTVTVNPAASVSLNCTSDEITNVQTTSCTPVVTGMSANTVNLTLSPTTAGTLSATTNVASGTPVVFTPAFTVGAQTPTITAVSTVDATKSAAEQITVTLRTITISAPTGNIWLPICAGIVIYNTAQTGMVNGDTIHDDPYPSAALTSTPPSTFPISMGIGNDPGVAGACSPGAYDEYVTGTDGARSNDQYVPILSPFNMWAGYNTTDEFQADFAKGTTWKYKSADGTPDGSLPVVGLVTIVDGNYLIDGALNNTGLLVYNVTTGALANGINNSGGNIVDFAAKNGIVGYTTTNKEVSFSLEASGSANLANLQNVGTAPAAIVGSTGCNPNSSAASFFSYDQAGSTIYRSDAIGNASAGTVTASPVNSVTLSGFSPASALPTNLARYVVAWDSSCKVAMLAPVLTGGTNPDGSKAYVMEFALADMSTGRQLGTYVSGIPSTAIRMAADPAGNDVVISSTNQAAGTTVLTRISWTLDSNENPTFSVTTLNSAPPVGVYGVSLGILPNGKITVGQRQQHYVLANQ